MQITPEQIHAARALLRLDQAALAERSRLPVVTVRETEALDAAEHVDPAVIESLRHALEEAGIEFFYQGVRKRGIRPDAQQRFERIQEISRRSAEKLKGRDDLLTDNDLYDENGLPA